MVNTDGGERTEHVRRSCGDSVAEPRFTDLTKAMSRCGAEENASEATEPEAFEQSERRAMPTTS